MGRQEEIAIGDVVYYFCMGTSIGNVELGNFVFEGLPLRGFRNHVDRGQRILTWYVYHSYKQLPLVSYFCKISRPVVLELTKGANFCTCHLYLVFLAESLGTFYTKNCIPHAKKIYSGQVEVTH